jgi:L-aminopeptidase/D-esterase-like protein
MTNDTLTAVPGVLVGHWTHSQGHTGCTVVVLPEPNVVAWEVRGAAPGSRETAILEPGMRVEQAQALVLTGGSAFGLATADGVMSQLEMEGRGHPTPVGPVPIVPAAVVFDLRPGMPRPGPEDGASAYRSAGADPVEQGLVGAGAGTTVAKWRGFEHARPGGVGSATVTIGAVVVGALVVANAVGDVFSLEGESLTGGWAVPGPPALFPPAGNTTLAVVATNARLSRLDLLRVAVRAQDAYAVCLRPAHTRYDGDACFTVSCGQEDLSVDLVSEAAFESVGRALARAIASSRSGGG